MVLEHTTTHAKGKNTACVMSLAARVETVLTPYGSEARIITVKYETKDFRAHC
jgi:hypothetical protein